MSNPALDVLVLLLSASTVVAALRFKKASDDLVRALSEQVEFLAARVADLTNNDDERSRAQAMFRSMRKRRLSE